VTRARYETVIWVPRGSRTGEERYNRTRDGAAHDAVAAYLERCGARALSGASSAALPQSVADPLL
jgi:hypothetical protein